jgi:hypothetical protein
LAFDEAITTHEDITASLTDSGFTTWDDHFSNSDKACCPITCEIKYHDGTNWVILTSSDNVYEENGILKA